ncbi:hypothetical protein D3C75_1378460 [compost metagenome]
MASFLAFSIWPFTAKELKVLRNLSLSTPWVARNSAISSGLASFLPSRWMAANTASCTLGSTPMASRVRNI